MAGHDRPESPAVCRRSHPAGHVREKSARIAGTDDELKAVRTAIDFEARGVALYTKLAKQSTDAKEIAFFNMLASVERQHLLSLKDTEEFLADPATWYQHMERSGLDGA